MFKKQIKLGIPSSQTTLLEGSPCPLTLPAIGVSRESFQATLRSCLKMDSTTGWGGLYVPSCAFAIGGTPPSASFLSLSGVEKAGLDWPMGTV